jgi:asparagine N-glycosylation enzyme membrane subunit Stt3
MDTPEPASNDCGMAIWQILLAVYLLLVAILALTNVTFAYAPVVLGLLAAATAICLFCRK